VPRSAEGVTAKRGYVVTYPIRIFLRPRAKITITIQNQKDIRYGERYRFGAYYRGRPAAPVLFGVLTWGSQLLMVLVTELVRLTGHRSRTLLPVFEDLFGLRSRKGEPFFVRARVWL
jgi:hypothetical protein